MAGAIANILTMLEFEWDENKRLSNLHKHGINFVDVPLIFAGATVTVEDNRYNYGEQRFVTFGSWLDRPIRGS